MHTCKHTNTHARVHTRARMSRGLMSFACLSPLPRTGKLRWCVLKDGNIYYFKTPSDEVQRGQFSLSRLSIKQVSTESRPWAFQVGVLVCVCVCVCVRVYACLFSSLLFSSLLFSSLLFSALGGTQCRFSPNCLHAFPQLVPPTSKGRAWVLAAPSKAEMAKWIQV